MLKNLFFAGTLKVNDENWRIRIQDPDPWDPDPDPPQNDMDPQHCYQLRYRKPRRTRTELVAATDA